MADGLEQPGTTIARGQFAKLDEERQIAFGWAYVVQVGDEVVLDHSGDFVDEQALPNLEDSIYKYVLESRAADEMHQRFGGVGQLVESVMLTPEKMEAMGVQSDAVGWWVGFKLADDVWAKVKDGTYGSFSIRGVGRREEVEEDDAAA